MGIEKNIFQQAYSQGKGLITSENKNLLVPIPDIVEGKAMGILKGAGLGLLKAKFFRINAAQAAEEKVANGEVIELGGKSKTGFFGLPIWDTVKLSFDTFSDNEGNSVTGEEMEFDIALIDVIPDSLRELTIEPTKPVGLSAGVVGAVAATGGFATGAAAAVGAVVGGGAAGGFVSAEGILDFTASPDDVVRVPPDSVRIAFVGTLDVATA